MLRSDPSTSSARTGSGPGSNPSHTAHAADSPGSVPVPAHAPPGPSPPPAPQAPSSSKPQTRLNKFLLPFTEVFHLGSSSSSSQSHHNSNSSSSSPRETSSATSPTSAAKHSGQHNQHQQHREPVAVSDQPAQHQLHQQPQQQQPQPKLRRAPSLVSRISRSSQLGQSFRSLFSSNKSSSASSARLKNSASTQCLSSTVNPALVQPTASPLGAAAPASSPLAPIDESTTHLPPATPTLAPRPLNKRWSAADLRAAAAAAPEDVDGLAHVIAPMVAAESSSTDHLPEGGHDALVMQQPAADHGTVIGPPAPPLGPGASRGSRRSLASRPSVMDLFSAMTAETPASGGQGQQQQQDYASAGAVVDLSRPIPVNVQQPIQADAQESSDSLGDALPLDMGGIGSGAVASGSESVGGSAGAEDKFFDAQSHLSTTDAGDQTRPQTPAVVVASTPPPGMKPISTKPQRPTLVPLVISRANSPLSSGPALMSPTHVAFLRSNASHLASYQHSVPSNIGTSTESSERAYADRHEYHQQLYEINQQMAHVGHVPPASPSTPGPNGAGSMHLHRVGSVGPSSGSQYRHSMGGHPHASSAGGGLAVPSPTGSPVPWHHHQNAASGMTPLGTGIPGLPTSQGAGGAGNRGGPAHAVNAYATATRSMSSAAIGSGGSGMTSSASAQHLAHIAKPQPLYPNKSLLPAKPVVVAPTPVVPGQGPQQQQQQPTAAPAPEKPQAKSVAQSMLERYKLLPEFESKYVVGDELGSGGFGFVVTAIRIQDQVEVAVKFIFKDKVPVHSLVKDPVLGVIPMEVYILKNMRHPNIIGFHDFFTDKRFYYLVMELHGVPWKKNTDPTAVRSQSAQPPQAHRSASESTVAGRPPVLGKRHSMDLFECIEANSRLSEDIARKIFGQVVSAVHYLDSYRIVHRDIKDENIVVDQHFIVKIIDFGSALMVPSNGRLFDRFAGTLQYCPPEVLQGHKYRGPEQEVWALGILLYTILFSGAPFANVSQVLNAEVPIPKYSRGPSAGKPRASEEVIHLLRWMLKKSPSDRASIEQVLTHPWLAKRPPAPPMAAPAAGETGAEAVVDAQRRASQSSQQPLEPPHNPRLHSSPEQYGTGIVRGKSPVPTAVPSMDHHHHHHHHQPQQQQLLRRATPSGNLQEMFKAGLVSTSSPQQPQQPSSSLSVTSSSSDIVPSFTTTSPSPAPTAQYLSAALISVPAKRHPLQQEVLPDSPSPSPAPSPLVGRPKDPLAQVQQNGSAASAAI